MELSLARLLPYRLSEAVSYTHLDVYKRQVLLLHTAKEALEVATPIERRTQLDLHLLTDMRRELFEGEQRTIHALSLIHIYPMHPSKSQKLEARSRTPG